MPASKTPSGRSWPGSKSTSPSRWSLPGWSASWRIWAGGACDALRRNDVHVLDAARRLADLGREREAHAQQILIAQHVEAVLGQECPHLLRPEGGAQRLA